MSNEIRLKNFLNDSGIKVQSVKCSAVFNGNWACKNYLDRREDAVNIKRHYYGKVGALGYLVGSDEFKEGDFDKEYFDFVEELHANSRGN